jgi:UrcA family protein
MTFRRITSLALATALAALTLVGVPLLAHADPGVAMAAETVRYDELNLATDAGVQALYDRIQNAARNVCGPESIIGTHIPSQGWKDCVGAAIRQAILAVNKPQLTAYYAQHLRTPISRTAG